jgi:serine/threonine-protein kinase
MGVIMYQMFTGELPFTAAEAADLAQAHRYKNVRPPIELNPEIPPALNEIMLKVLAKEPSARYRTADQLGRVLLTFAAPAEVAAAEAYSKPEKSKRTGPQAKAEIETAIETDWISVGLGLLAALLVGGLLPFWMWVYLVFNPPIQ